MFGLGGARAVERPPQGGLISYEEGVRVTYLEGHTGLHDAEGPRVVVLSEDNCSFTLAGRKPEEAL